MEYRLLGNSGCAVSRLALGTMTFGAETTPETAHTQLDTFVEHGGNLIDTADVYGAGASEQIIGQWLAGRPGRPGTPSSWPPKDGSRWEMHPTTRVCRDDICSELWMIRSVGWESIASTSTRCTAGIR